MTTKRITLFRMYKLSNICFNCAYLCAFLFLILSWSLDHIDVWLTQVVIPAVTICILLGFLFKYIARKLGHEPPKRKIKQQNAKNDDQDAA